MQIDARVRTFFRFINLAAHKEVARMSTPPMHQLRNIVSASLIIKHTLLFDGNFTF